MSPSETSITLDYGTTGLPLNIEGLNATVLKPQFIAGLADEQASFQAACASPIASAPLADRIKADETVAVAIPDITRALPSDRLLPWLFDALSHVPAKNIAIVIGTGTHRANTKEELIKMVGRQVVENYTIVNHDARDYDRMKKAGASPFGYDVYFNKEYAEADRRICLGFIEPHFMAGFSGGYKAAFPGVANLDAIMRYHGFENIAHPRSAWGLIQNNPTQDHVLAAGSLLPVDFLINVTLNNRHQITRFFCGDPIKAHDSGCRFSKENAMVAVDAPFPIVVTTNSGYPLDLNLYQTVKGMAAAHQIAEKSGLIIAAGRCNDGIPEHGGFKEQLFRYASPDAILDALQEPGFAEIDQWQTQKLIQILISNRIQLFSELDPATVKRTHIEPISDIRKAIDRELEKRGDPQTPIAFLPEGPMTIPYIK